MFICFNLSEVIGLFAHENIGIYLLRVFFANLYREKVDIKEDQS